MMCEDFLWRHFMYAAKWSQMDSCLTNIALVCTIATLTRRDNNSKEKCNVLRSTNSVQCQNYVPVFTVMRTYTQLILNFVCSTIQT